MSRLFCFFSQKASTFQCVGGFLMILDSFLLGVQVYELSTLHKLLG
jgi:hypothetical protein